MCAAENTSDKPSYRVDQIIGCEFDEKNHRVLYKVKWARVNRNKRCEINFEPTHHLQACPLLFMKYETKLHKKLATTRGHPNGPVKKPISEVLTTVPLNVPESEYLPNENDFVHKIYTMWKANHDELFLVEFKGSRDFKVVQRVFMDYYFPVNVVLFMQEINYPVDP